MSADQPSSLNEGDNKEVVDDNFDILAHIIREYAENKASTASGVLHRTSTQDPLSIDEEIELEDSFLRPNPCIDVDDDDDVDITYNDPIQVGGPSSRSMKCTTTTISDRKTKESRAQQLGEAIKAWAECARAKTQATLSSMQTTSVKEENVSDPRNTSIQACQVILNAIDDVDDDTYLKACKEFTNSAWRELFVGMPMRRRRHWLNCLKNNRRLW